MKNQLKEVPLHGFFERSVSRKGRIQLPQEIITQLNERGTREFWVSPILRGAALVLYPADIWPEWLELARKNLPLMETERDITGLTSLSKKKSLGSRGRLFLTPRMWRHAEIDPPCDAIIMGALERLEIWSLENQDTALHGCERLLISDNDREGERI